MMQAFRSSDQTKRSASIVEIEGVWHQDISTVESNVAELNQKVDLMSQASNEMLDKCDMLQAEFRALARELRFGEADQKGSRVNSLGAAGICSYRQELQAMKLEQEEELRFSGSMLKERAPSIRPRTRMSLNRGLPLTSVAQPTINANEEDTDSDKSHANCTAAVTYKNGSLDC
mmetsp:Transcript_15059/g.32717  ORF Transcript_15059/g.32717 Transcript_15059/m.32717 type:complete len:174 (-) Transcript_15059:349-870(-)